MPETQANGASATATNVEVVTGTTSKPTVFSGNHDNDWTNWERKMMAHLMKKGLYLCLDPDFETRLLAKESGPFNVAVEVEQNFKEAADSNNKAMCLSNNETSQKVNLQNKADKLIPCGRA